MCVLWRWERFRTIILYPFDVCQWSEIIQGVERFVSLFSGQQIFFCSFLRTSCIYNHAYIIFIYTHTYVYIRLCIPLGVYLLTYLLINFFLTSWCQMLFSQRDKYSLNETFPVFFWMNKGKFRWGWWSLVDSNSWKTRVFSRQVNYNNLLTSSHRFPPVLRYGHVGYVKHGGGKVWLDAVPRRNGLPQHVGRGSLSSVRLGVIPKILWRSQKIVFHPKLA